MLGEGCVSARGKECLASADLYSAHAILHGKQGFFYISHAPIMPGFMLPFGATFSIKDTHDLHCS